MRTFISSLIAASLGFLQIVAGFVLELIYAPSPDESTDYGVRLGEAAFVVFAICVTVEIICTMVLALYRFTPWICALLGANWEANRIRKERPLVERSIVSAVAAAVVIRRLLMLMAGVLTPESFVSALLPFVALAIPRQSKRV